MIKLVAVGDISLGDHYFNLGHGTGSFGAQHGLTQIFAPVREQFVGADIVFGNLETPLRSGGMTRAHGFAESVFCGDTSMAAGLKAAGFNVLNVASNHIMQHGETVFDETVNSLTDVGIDVVGLTSGSPNHCKAVFKQVGDRVVAILGYTDIREVYLPTQTGVARFAREAVADDIKSVSQQADLIIVSLHFGTEGTTLPTAVARQTARWLIDTGAHVVLGHHTHVFQPVERYGSGVIAYSMGDFVFDLFWKRGVHQFSAITHIEIDSLDGPTIRIVPTEFARDYSVRALNQRDSRALLDSLAQRTQMLAVEDDVEYERTVQHELESHTRFENVRKLQYFLGAFLKGATGKKVAFLVRKLAHRVGR